MGFLSPTTLEDWRIHCPGACLTPFVALTGFLSLSAPCSPPDRPALFHAGNAHGVSPSEPFPLEEPYRLSAAFALLTFTVLPRSVLPIRPSARNGANPVDHLRHLRDRARRTPSTPWTYTAHEMPREPLRLRHTSRSSRTGPLALTVRTRRQQVPACAAGRSRLRRLRTRCLSGASDRAPSPPELAPRPARADGPNTPLEQRRPPGRPGRHPKATAAPAPGDLAGAATSRCALGLGATRTRGPACHRGVTRCRARRRPAGPRRATGATPKRDPETLRGQPLASLPTSPSPPASSRGPKPARRDLWIRRTAGRRGTAMPAWVRCTRGTACHAGATLTAPVCAPRRLRVARPAGPGPKARLTARVSRAAAPSGDRGLLPSATAAPERDSLGEGPSSSANLAVSAPRGPPGRDGPKPTTLLEVLDAEPSGDEGTWRTVCPAATHLAVRRAPGTGPSPRRS